MFNCKNMKLLLGLSMMLLLFISQASNVVAANNQGLEWGVEVGDRLDYDVEVTYHNTTLDLDLDDQMYVIIDDLPSIADDITSLLHLVHPSMILEHYTTYWANGTVMDELWENTLKMTAFTLFPIGNWSLITQLYEDETSSANVTQDSSTLTLTFENIPNPGNNQTMVLSKVDGGPIYSLYNVTWGMETSVTVKLTRETPTASTDTTFNSPPEPDITLLLVLGGSAAVVVVILILILIRRK